MLGGRNSIKHQYVFELLDSGPLAKDKAMESTILQGHERRQLHQSPRGPIWIRKFYSRRSEVSHHKTLQRRLMLEQGFPLFSVSCTCVVYKFVDSRYVILLYQVRQ